MDAERESFYFVGIRFIDVPDERAFNFCEGFLIQMLQENYKILYFSIDSNLYFFVSFIDDSLKNQ